MRIAVVGKGGSGKSTVAAALIQRLREAKSTVWAIDADINMHLGPLLGIDASVESSKHLSHSRAIEAIKTYLIGENPRIVSLSAFRKTTPPGTGSNLVSIHQLAQVPMNRFDFGRDSFHLMVVGSYTEEGIGASCYHNNLSILENVLSHSLDEDGWIVVDMVAGTDAFASTLHAQFDVILLVVEPTQHSLDVWRQFLVLAKSAGVDSRLFAIGNKVSSAEDELLFRDNIPSEKIVGFIRDSPYIRNLSRKGGIFHFNEWEFENKQTIQRILDFVSTKSISPLERYSHLCALHRKYVQQSFIVSQFGDLTTQIDPAFVPLARQVNQ
jgi:CO dehydrogenase maturation factor